MICFKRIVLDVLKPHHPDAFEFASAIAACGSDYRVHLTVLEMDERTESLRVVVTGTAIDTERVRAAIAELGASLHSIDEVEVQAVADDV